jgi:uncharacterized protein YkwD
MPVRSVVFAAALLALAACQPAPQASRGAVAPAEGSVAADVLSLTDGARRARGLAPLRPDATLAALARQQAAHMARVGAMVHAGPRGATFQQRLRRGGYGSCAAAENIGEGWREPSRIASEWLRSPAHLRNIVDPRMSHGAVAVAYGADGNPYWSMMLGRPC